MSQLSQQLPVTVSKTLVSSLLAVSGLLPVAVLRLSADSACGVTSDDSACGVNSAASACSVISAGSACGAVIALLTGHSN